MNVTNVYVVVEHHPYGALVVFLLFLFMLGVIASFFTNVWGGVKVLGTAGYYATAPLHMPVRWAYRKVRAI